MLYFFLSIEEYKGGMIYSTKEVAPTERKGTHVKKK